jgi:hypothetical protein
MKMEMEGGGGTREAGLRRSKSEREGEGARK